MRRWLCWGDTAWLEVALWVLEKLIGGRGLGRRALEDGLDLRSCGGRGGGTGASG